MSYICVNDLAEIAKEKLPSDIFNFIAGGAMNEITLNRNEAAFKEQLILPRCLNPVGQLNTSIQLFDKCLSAPIFASPIAFQSLAHPEGEIATMRAIDALQLGMISSTMSSKSLEQIASEAHFAALYFQLYIYKNRTFTERLIKRAERANYQAIVITIDVPIMGRRYRDIRAKFNLPTHCIAENLPEELVEELHSQHNSDASTVMQFTNQHFANDLSWGDISWVKSLTDLPVILKGIMHPLDAREAISHGIDGIIVSNHGGRQLDSVPATIEVLSSISQIVNQKIPILIDGGIRNGIDIFKALALGADVVCIGRPIFWGLAVDGEQGVRKALNFYLSELQETMVLCGCSSIDEIKQKGKQLLFKAAT